MGSNSCWSCVVPYTPPPSSAAPAASTATVPGTDSTAEPSRANPRWLRDSLVPGSALEPASTSSAFSLGREWE